MHWAVQNLARIAQPVKSRVSVWLHQALFVVRPVYNYAQRIVKMWTRVVAKVRAMAATMVTMAMMMAEQQ